MTEDLPDSQEAESPPSKIYDEGRTVGEIARHFGVPSGTVKSRAHHALRALRLVLKEVEAA